LASPVRPGKKLTANSSKMKVPPAPSEAPQSPTSVEVNSRLSNRSDARKSSNSNSGRQLSFRVEEGTAGCGDINQDDSVDRSESNAGSVAGHQLSLQASTATELLTHTTSTSPPSAQTRFLLRPHSLPKLAWDVIVASITIVMGVMVPVTLVYLRPEDVGWQHEFFNFVVVIWVVDIILNFRTCYEHKGFLVSDPWLIAAKYLRGWFLLDLVVVLSVSSSVGTLQDDNGVAFLFLSALKLLRLLRLGPLVDQLPKSYQVPTKVLVVVGLLSHVMACAWRVVRQQGFTPDPHTDSWVDLYILDLYWVMMTMTTVGYGDIPPENTGDRIYAILAMLVSPLFFGTVVSLLTHITQGFFNDEIELRLKETVRFLRRRKITAQLQRRVMQNLQSRIREEHQLTLPPDLFAKLSPWVQRELSLELVSATVLRFPLFRGAQHSFAADLAVLHSWVYCQQGDLVVESGQLLQELVFVIHGRLLVTRQNREDDTANCMMKEQALRKHSPPPFALDAMCEVEVGAGGWIGEACLFDNTCVRETTAYAAEESELAVLQASDYHSLIVKYPHLSAKHKSLEQAIKNGTLRMDKLAFKRTPSFDNSRQRNRKSFFRLGDRTITTLRLASERSSVSLERPEGPDTLLHRLQRKFVRDK